MPGPSSVACPKPEPRSRTKGRQDRAKHAHVRIIRREVFAMHDDTCVVCGHRAESMHEIIPASVVGNRIEATTIQNSVSTCGSGTTGCHGLLQQKIVYPVQGKAHLRWMVDLDYMRHPEVIALAKRASQARAMTEVI